MKHEIVIEVTVTTPDNVPRQDVVNSLWAYVEEKKLQDGWSIETQLVKERNHHGY